MLTLKVLHFLEGYIKFEGKSQSPNIFINCISKNRLNIWGLYCDKDFVSGYIVKSQFNDLIKIAEKSNTKIENSYNYGLPFLLNFFKNRKGLVVGFILFFATIMFLSNFLWSVDISVDGDLDQKSIEKTLTDLGVKNGAYLKNIDTEMAEKELMLRENNVSWVAINLTGCVAQVQLSEKIEPPKNETDQTPCNLIATDDGQIIKSEVVAGQKEFQIFQAVVKGNLLVNGIIQKENSPAIYKHSKGKVYALVRKNTQIEIPLKTEEEVLTDEKINIRKINVFNLNMPLTLAPKPVGNYQQSINKYSLSLFNINLPVSITANTFTKKENVPKILSTEQAKEIAKAKLDEQINSMPDTKMISKEENFEENQDKITLNANLLLEKNIAQEAPLAVNNPS